MKILKALVLVPAVFCFATVAQADAYFANMSPDFNSAQTFTLMSNDHYRIHYDYSASPTQPFTFSCLVAFAPGAKHKPEVKFLYKINGKDQCAEVPESGGNISFFINKFSPGPYEIDSPVGNLDIKVGGHKDNSKGDDSSDVTFTCSVAASSPAPHK